MKTALGFVLGNLGNAKAVPEERAVAFSRFD